MSNLLHHPSNLDLDPGAICMLDLDEVMVNAAVALLELKHAVFLPFPFMFVSHTYLLSLYLIQLQLLG